MIDLEAIESRVNAATPGPWHTKLGDGVTFDIQAVVTSATGEICGHRQLGYRDARNYENNADFIAHAREDIPALLAEVKRQADEIEAVTAERDAAVEDLRKNRARKCDCCAYAGRSERWPCVDCQSSISNYGDGWKWRGAGKEQNDG